MKALGKMTDVMQQLGISPTHAQILIDYSPR